MIRSHFGVIAIAAMVGVAGVPPAAGGRFAPGA